MRHLASVAFFITTTALAGAAGPAAPISAPDLEFFETKIRPVLADQCYRCHSSQSEKLRADLNLDTRASTLEGGESGPALVPGKPDDSLLIQAIRYGNPDLRMPPKGNKLPDDVIANFEEWVRRGAPDPRTAPAATKVAAAHAYAPSKDHWSFKPVVQPAVPVTKHPEWCLTPVDNFILADLEAAGMQPSPVTNRRTLLRRVTYDLTGLPPTEPEILAFDNDKSPDAYTKVVDRLLASPHYGERSARAWLDLARFSDTKGNVKRREDPRYPGAWTYRDYVIDAFNTDKPYNTFVTEQLAADFLVKSALNRKSLPADTSPGDRRVLAAMGFLTLGNQFDGNNNDVINDRIDVTSKAFLGLTVSCARCHDHKFDPIPTKDYYSLYGIFASSTQPARVSDLPTLKPVVETADYKDYQTKSAELDTKEAALREEIQSLRRDGDKDPEKRRLLLRQQVVLQSEIGDLEADHPGAPPRADVLIDSRNPRDFPVLIRGEAQNKGDVAPRRFLEILSSDPAKRPAYSNGSGRLELARDITDPANPLTARVLVNRIWQQHFGEGFVPTPDDLGNQSAPPSHPALVDYLAARFVKDGWSIKQLHRLIVLSATYQQGDSGNTAYAVKDPYNRLLWRANLRRLDLEEMHDAILAISGTLDPTVGGKSVRLSSEGFASRRALYTFIDRRNPPELFTQFDFPSPDVPSGRRYETTVPQQALFFMNNPLIIETARKLTQRPEFTKLTRTEDRVVSLYVAILQRSPTLREITLATNYVKSTPTGPEASVFRLAPADTSLRDKRQNQNPLRRFLETGPVGGAKNQGPLDPWARLAHALFQTNEAVFYN
ncbi:MAG: PSD1 and planctomycete cytochrome C domain-containing protein [Rariglobus sp.]|nr:PSD1 and planctomycete cytochrome C domain-containing protein [Rariglobus sp.]